MDAYERCCLCPRKCGVNRQHGERGYCGMTSELVLARAALHHWEEPCVSGVRGSGTVFFSGCPLQCAYCQNREIATGHHGKKVTSERLSEIFFELAEQGTHNINLVTPTHYAPTIAAAIRNAKQAGFALPFIWNTSGYECVETLSYMEGLIDIYLTDLRYMLPQTAAKYSKALDYPSIAKAAAKEMVRQTGSCALDADGLIKSGTIVRILLLPGLVGEAKLALLHLWRAYGDQIIVSLMQQYTPMPGLASPLDRRVSEEEYKSLVSYAESLGITNAYTQEREAATSSFIPKFDTTGV